MLTGIAFILLGYYVAMPAGVSIFLYVLGGLRLLNRIMQALLRFLKWINRLIQDE